MKKIGVIGVGNMGMHLTKLIFRNKLGPQLLVADQNIQAARKRLIYLNQDLFRPVEEVIQESNILFLTVKPGNIKEVCQLIQKSDQNHLKTVVSVAAGVPTERIESWLDYRHHVVRMMPNIPISENQGSIVWYSQDPRVQNVLNRICEGPEFLWVGEEGLIDVATVMFGCTPAYIARVFGVYLDMAVDMGFTEKQAQKLLAGTFTGTSEFLKKYQPEDIIHQVVSRGGATEKGLQVLTHNHFDNVLRESLRESYLRIQEITHRLQ